MVRINVYGTGEAKLTVMPVQPVFFPPFHLDPINERLWRGQQAIPLRPKAFAVLCYLAEIPGRLVTKEELLQAVWPESFVTDAVLKVSIREIRQAVGDDPETPKFIETVHRRGYRFVAEMADPSDRELSPRTATGSQDGWRFPFAQRADRPTALRSGGFVGRDAALAWIQEWLEKALRGSRRAVQYLRQAAENAARLYANREAIGHLIRALAWVERLPQPELAWLHEQAFDFESARELCEQGFQKAREVQLGYGQLMSMVLLGFAHLGLERYESAFHCFDEMAHRIEKEHILMGHAILLYDYQAVPGVYGLVFRDIYFFYSPCLGCL